MALGFFDVVIGTKSVGMGGAPSSCTMICMLVVSILVKSLLKVRVVAYANISSKGF